ncbi:MAG: tetratricopeptide repeat protein [Phycisphaeraceae bacterium]|nr:tetratricopeptide repeat protein [Phycisphaeraceae bacterium]
MPARVNTRFVTILIIVLLVIAAGVAGAMRLLQNEADNFAKAQELERSGQLADALELYDRVVHKKPNNYEWIIAYVDAMDKLKTSDAYEAQETIRNTLSWLKQAINVRPDDSAAFSRFMDYCERAAKVAGGGLGYWTTIHTEAEARLAKHHDEQAAWRYRGMAQVNRMRELNLNLDERQQAQKDLSAVLAKDPDDVEATYYLALWNLLEARELERAGAMSEEIAKARETAKDLTGGLLARRPQDPRAQAYHAMVLVSLRQMDEAGALATELEKSLEGGLGDEDLELVQQLVMLLPVVDRQMVATEEGRQVQRGYQRAAGVLAVAIERWPDSLPLKLMLGGVRKSLEDTDGALAAFASARDYQGQLHPIQAQVLASQKATATYELADLLLTKAGRATGSDEATMHEAIDRARPLVQELVQAQPSAYGTLRLQGKLAYLENRLADASRLLNDASNMVNNADIEVLLMAASASEKINQLGDAAAKLQRVLELNPELSVHRRSLARIYLRTNQLDQAQTQIQRLLEKDPRDGEALRLGAVLATRQGNYDRAITIFESMNWRENRQLKLGLASMYILAKKPERARELLDQLFAEDASDPETLRLLLSLTPDPEQARALIARSGEAGLSTQAVELLQAQVSGPEAMSSVMEKMMEEVKEEDPFQWRMARYRMFQSQGKAEEARAELSEAARLKPEHGVVIHEQFQQALADDDMAVAQKLADQAGQLNLDGAEGRFFQGQIHLHQEDYPKAIGMFRQALKMRPIYSDGWQILARAHQAAGELEAAVEAYKRAIDQRPDNVAALRGLASIQAARGQNDQALATLETAVRMDPENLDLQSLVLGLQERYGDKQEVLRQRLKLAADQPRYYENRRSLAMLQAQLGQAGAAFAAIDTVVEEEGRTRQNVMTAAMVRYEARQVRAAQDILVRYVQELGEKATAADWMMLGRFMVRINALDQASQAYQQAIGLEDARQLATREWADTLFSRQRDREAAELYKKLHEKQPKDARVTLRYIETLTRGGQLDEASLLLAELVRDVGEDARTQLLRGSIAQSQSGAALLRGDMDEASGQRAAALSAFGKAIELGPRNAVGYVKRAGLLQSDPTQDAQVLADLNQALTLDPNLAQARELLVGLHLRRDERQEAQRQLREMIERSPEYVQARVTLASLMLQDKQYPQLRQFIDQSAALFPTDPTWPQWRATLALAQGQIDEALTHLQSAFSLAPSPSTLAAVVQAMVQNNRHQAALSLLDQQQAGVSRQPYLLALRGRALVGVGQAGPAREAFGQAIEQSTQMQQLQAVADQMVGALGAESAIAALTEMEEGFRAPAAVELMIASIEIGAGRPGEAVERVTRARGMIPAESPMSGMAQRLLAIGQIQAGLNDAAVESLRALIKNNPTDVESLNNLAFVLADKLGRAKEALPYAQQASSLDPRNPEILDTLGWAQYKSGQANEGKETLLRAARIRPTPYTAYHLGLIFLEQGQSLPAREQFEAARNLAQQGGDQELLKLIESQLAPLAPMNN